MENVRSHFDLIASDYDRWKDKAHFYYEHLKQILSSIIPQKQTICEVGSGTGDIIASLRPRKGVGLDISSEMVAEARKKHPDISFQTMDILESHLNEHFDFVIAVDVAEHVANLNQAVRNMSEMMTAGGTLILTTANPSWRFFLEIAEKLHFKMPEGEHEWRSYDQLCAAVEHAGLKVVGYQKSLLVPKRVPLLARLNEASWAERLRERWGLVQCLQAQRLTNEAT